MYPQDGTSASLNTTGAFPKLPNLGFGLGLRSEHYAYILKHHPSIDWFEIITENFLVPGGRPIYYLDQIKAQYPIVMHGVSLSIGSTDPLNQTYLNQVKNLIKRVEPAWISDHLCWTGVNGTNMHDLLPLPYSDEALKHIVDRIKQVQDFFGRQILIENVSSYVTYRDSVYSEWEFLNLVACEADCLILLDINNIYVSSFNHHFDPYTYLNAIDIERVQQFHLAGHSHLGDYIIDTHDDEVIPPVWLLYQQAVKRFGAVATMIERDDDIPNFPVLYQELMHAKTISQQVLAEVACQD